MQKRHFGVNRNSGFARRASLSACGFIALCLSLSVSVGVALASSGDDLEKLEQKFFQHTYLKDTDSARIDRIEKFVYGEPKTGSIESRLSALMQTVPAGETAIDQDGASAQAGETASSSHTTPSEPVASSRQSKSRDSVSAAPPQQTKPKKVAARPPVDSNEPTRVGTLSRTKSASRPANDDAAPPHENVSGTKYPAVTAIEQKILHTSHENERVEDRLARLETSVFGKASPSADLIDRVDRLKSKTGIDIAARPPGGSDWSDEDDDMLLPPTQAAAPPTSRGSRGPIDGVDGEDGMSFSGRNLRKDMQNAFGGMSTGGGGGSYGMSSGSMGGSWGTTSGSSGRYGFGGGTSPRTAGGGGPRSAGSNPGPIRTPQTSSVAGMGLSQQVAAMEQEILGKAYTKEPLAPRLSRLEAQIFPGDKSLESKPLPERVNKLLSQVPISNTSTVPAAAPPRVAQRGKNKDLLNDDDDLDEMDLPGIAPQRGLGKVMNQLGQMFNQTNFVGGFPVAGGNLITDPSTGMLLDRTTGNLIDPSTGQVIGRRVAPSPYVTPPIYAAPPIYGTPGVAVPPFSNGFAPYGAGTGIRYGVGAPGIAPGTGMRMWP
jgi:hypothetical protein